MNDPETLRHILLTKNVELRRKDIDCILIGSDSKKCTPSPQWVVFYLPYRSRKNYTMYRGGDLGEALEAFLLAPLRKVPPDQDARQIDEGL